MPGFRAEAHFVVSLLLVGLMVALRSADHRPPLGKVVQKGPAEWVWDLDGTSSQVEARSGFAVSWLAVGQPVPLNHADVRMLQTVPGIGPARAEAIHRNRALYGPFNRMSDLDRVRGFGPKTVNSVAQYLHVGQLSVVSTGEG